MIVQLGGRLVLFCDGPLIGCSDTCRARLETTADRYNDVRPLAEKAGWRVLRYARHVDWRGTFDLCPHCEE